MKPLIRTTPAAVFLATTIALVTPVSTTAEISPLFDG